MLSRCALSRITLGYGRLRYPLTRLENRISSFETLGTISVPLSFPRSFSVTGIRFGELYIVKTPAFAESVTSGDIRWTKEVGDSVSADEAIAEIETDKTSIPINSPVSGIVKSIMVEDGESVEAHQEVAQIEEGEAVANVEKQVSEPKSTTEAKIEEVSTTPIRSEIPKEAPPVPAMPRQPISTTPVSEVKPREAPKDTDIVGGFSRAETRVKMNRMRMKISRRLKEAQNTAAMLTTFNEIDMSNAIELRNQHKKKFEEKHNLKLTFMSAFVKAAVYALQDSPIVNAVIDDNHNEIVYRDYIDISVAVATPKGLVVPVLRNCNNMNYVDIERGIAQLAERARNGQLAIEDMDGGTFTVSNGGVFGSLFGTPILNPPQSAILGMHAINERAVVVNGKVEVRPVMFVALTYDHRLLDGREAVLFLRKIKTAIEDPRMMLLDL